MQLNADKIDIKRNKNDFILFRFFFFYFQWERTRRIVSSNLQWNSHICELIISTVNCVIRKLNVYIFQQLLKRARVGQQDDIVNFYCITIRAVLEYCLLTCLPTHALPKYLYEEIEIIQKRSLNITSPNLSYIYNDNLEILLRNSTIWLL